MTKNIYEQYSIYLLTQKKLNQTSVARYIRILKRLEEQVKINLLFLNCQHIDTYFNSIKRFKESYQRLHINVITNFYKWLYTTKKIKFNPAANLKGIGRTSPDFSLLKEQDLNLFLNFPEKTWRDVRNKFFFLIMYHTGLKVSEIISLKQSDINKKDHTIKLSAKRNVKLPEKLCNDLLIYIYKQNLNNYIFTDDKEKKLSIRYMQILLKRYAEEMGLNSALFTTNNIRYCVMMRFLKNGLSLEEVKDLMGYSRVEDVKKIFNLHYSS